jgi:hypothetical protein
MALPARPHAITLLEVRKAVNEHSCFPDAPQAPTQPAPVGRISTGPRRAFAMGHSYQGLEFERTMIAMPAGSFKIPA